VNSAGAAQDIQTAPDDDGHDAQRRGLVWRRVILAITTMFIAAGLLGLLGVRTRTVSGADGPIEASVRYAQVGRGGVAAPYAITVTSDSGFAESIEITVDESYLELFDQNGIDPGPDGATAVGDVVIWTYDPPPGDEFTVTLDIRIGPSVQWGRTGHTVVVAEGHRIELSHHTWVMP
jgi:hypothetical protein